MKPTHLALSVSVTARGPQGALEVRVRFNFLSLCHTKDYYSPKTEQQMSLVVRGSFARGFEFIISFTVVACLTLAVACGDCGLPKIRVIRINCRLSHLADISSD